MSNPQPRSSIGRDADEVKAIQARALIPAVAAGEGIAGLLDVGQAHAIALGSIDDGGQSEVRIIDQVPRDASAAIVISEEADTIDRAVQSRRIRVMEDADACTLAPLRAHPMTPRTVGGIGYLKKEGRHHHQGIDQPHQCGAADAA